MNPVVMISIAAFLGAATLAAGILLMFKDFTKSKAENRLDALAGTKAPEAEASRGIMRQDFSSLGTGAMGVVGKAFGGMGGWGTFLEQANSPIDMQSLVLLCLGCGVIGPVIGIVAQLPGTFVAALRNSDGFTAIDMADLSPEASVCQVRKTDSRRPGPDRPCIAIGSQLERGFAHGGRRNGRSHLC